MRHSQHQAEQRCEKATLPAVHHEKKLTNNESQALNTRLHKIKPNHSDVLHPLSPK